MFQVCNHHWRSDHWLRFLALALLVAVFISACGLSSPHREPSPAANCRIVKHDAGETSICKPPETVAALTPLILDIMLALGIQPAAYADVGVLNLRQFDRPAEQVPYLGDRITTQPINLGSRDRPSLEALTLLKPDLILAETWHSQSTYDLLSKIAPTLLVNNEQGKWQHSIQVIANAVEKQEKAQQVVAAHYQHLDQTRNKLARVIASYPRMLVISSNPTLDAIFLDSYSSTSADLLDELGFHLVLLDGDTERDPTVRPQLSIEALSQLEADIIIVQIWDEKLADHSKQVQQQWSQNPILSTMQAYRSDRVYFVDYHLWGSNIHGPITDELILNQLPELLLSSQE